MPRLKLVIPDARYAKSHLEALAELEASGNHRFLAWLRLTRAEVESDFEGYVQRVRALQRLRASGLVPAVIYWAVVGDEFVGQISIRLELNRGLRDIGGHVGYEVRPTARGQGHATEMLRLLKEKALELGVPRLLVTCDETNVASRKVIERNGGFAVAPFSTGPDSPRKLRYWVSTVPMPGALTSAVDASVAYLGSKEAAASVTRDPYWPKWNSPWWHAVALWEIGLAHRIPTGLLTHLAETASRHYLHEFPLKEEDVPPGKDTYRDIICHCALGTLLRLMHECDVDVMRHFSWTWEWLSRYQLPDGGYNCDEQAYSRERPVSSIVSTVPMLEALVELERGGFDLPVRLADGAAEHVLSHRFCRSVRTGAVLRAEWPTPLFPRFYEYDVLRGLAAVCEWMALRQAWDRRPALAEARNMMEPWFQATTSHRAQPADQFSLVPNRAGGWDSGRASGFPLLSVLSDPQMARPFLECQWARVLWLLD